MVPDLGMPEVRLVASLWLVPLGKEVYEGDRLLEIHAGDVTYDLSAPATGLLAEQLVSEDETIEVGQVVGVITSSAAST